MLSKAKARKLYDELIQGELTKFLNTRTRAYDLIVSADTLCYFGSLTPVLLGVYNALKPGGFMAFTLEASQNNGPDFCLNPQGRYAHSRTYIDTVLGETGFKLHSITSQMLRMENKKPVMGHVVVVDKKAT